MGRALPDYGRSIHELHECVSAIDEIIARRDQSLPLLITGVLIVRSKNEASQGFTRKSVNPLMRRQLLHDVEQESAIAKLFASNSCRTYIGHPQQIVVSQVVKQASVPSAPPASFPVCRRGSKYPQCLLERTSMLWTE